jgi:hypothetical protein
MINTFGPYLLILIFGNTSMVIQEMRSFEDCQAALIQLQPVRQIHGYCIAAEVK